MDRDRILFEKLNYYGVMTTSQIAEVVFIGITLSTVLRRLRKLENADFLKRNFGLVSHELAWILTEKSARLVSNHLPKHRQSRFNVVHDTKLTDVRLALESSGLVRSWVAEHEIRHKVYQNYGVKRAGEKLIPDGLLGVLWHEVNENIAVELELTGKSSGRYKQIFRQYKYKESLIGVWYLVPTNTLGRQLKTVWQDVVKADSRPYFFWSLVDDVINNKENALIHLSGNSKTLGDAWSCNKPSAPAHVGAHHVSSLSKNIQPDELSVTAS
jgi:DNA-binding Lrp family transcriptional regulator